MKVKVSGESMNCELKIFTKKNKKQKTTYRKFQRSKFKFSMNWPLFTYYLHCIRYKQSRDDLNIWENVCSLDANPKILCYFL